MELWERQACEPNRWYGRFHAYLLAGSARSIAGAYHAGGGKSANAPAVWRKAARQYDWTRRAEAWDMEQRRQAEAVVAEARLLLQRNALRAAQVLVDNLTAGDARERREAAAEVLDRAGVMKVSKVEASGPDGGPIQLSNAERAARIAAIIEQLGVGAVGCAVDGGDAALP